MIDIRRYYNITSKSSRTVSRCSRLCLVSLDPKLCRENGKIIPGKLCLDIK